MRTKELEDENARTEEENKRILDTLDELNISMALSESWVKELQEAGCRPCKHHTTPQLPIKPPPYPGAYPV